MKTQLGREIKNMREHMGAIAIVNFSLGLFCLPFSTSLSSIFILSASLLTIITLRWGELVDALNRPTVALSVGLFLYLAITAFWSVGPVDDTVYGIGKYKKLLVVPLIVVALDRIKSGQNILYRAWFAGCAVVCTGSLMVLIGLTGSLLGPPDSPAGWQISMFGDIVQFRIGPPDNPTFGRNHITQGAFIAYTSIAAFCIWFGAARTGKDVILKYGMPILAIVTATIVFSLQGRTGYLLLVLGYGLCFIGLRNSFTRSLSFGLAIVICALCLAFTSKFDNFKNRVSEAYVEALHWSTDESGDNRTSQGIRLSYWNIGLRVISGNPLFGIGVGAYSTGYEREKNQSTPTANSEIPSTRQRHQPHSEWVLLGVQGGLIAVLIYAAILVSSLRAIMRLEQLSVRVAIGSILLLHYVNSIFNSTIWDYSEGYFFAYLIGVVNLASRLPRGKSKYAGFADSDEASPSKKF